MVDVNELKNRVSALNAKAQSLNDTRQRKLGAVETAKTRLNELLTAYKDTYGVDITDVSSEYTKVIAETENAVKALEQQIEYIESGAYKADLPAENVTTPAQNFNAVNTSISTGVAVKPAAVATPVMPTVPTTPVMPTASVLATPVPPTQNTPIIPNVAAAQVTQPAQSNANNANGTAGSITDVLPQNNTTAFSEMFAGVVAPASGFDVFDGSAANTASDVEEVNSEDEVVGAAFTPMGWGNSTPAQQTDALMQTNTPEVTATSAAPIDGLFNIAGVVPPVTPVAPAAPASTAPVEPTSTAPVAPNVSVQPVGMVDLSDATPKNDIEGVFGGLFNNQPFNLGG